MPYKLLLADDSVTIQRVIELTFADEDVQVILAGDGRQAIERVEAERPDIVLADIGMPERDGYDVAAFIKQHPLLSSIPVVLLTGAFEPLDEERARSVGCDGVLIKPFEPQVVINRVKELLAARRPSIPATAPPAAPPAAAEPEPARSGDPEGDAPPPAAAGDPLEAYFDRLDAAFASFGAVQSDGPAAEPQPPGTAMPGAADRVSVSPPGNGDPLSEWDVDETDQEPVEDPLLASAFAALLAAEQGLAEPALPAAPAPPAPPEITDDLIDRIAERVIARMADDSMRCLVAETAERLVRQEIDRIKELSGAAHTPPAG